MEHLRRNTNNERIISLFQTSLIKQEKATNESIKTVILRINNLFTAVLSFLVTNFLISPLSKVSHNLIRCIIYATLFITIFILFWCVFSKILKYIEKREAQKVNINKEIDIINVYNTEIIPAMAEIHEALSISITTSDDECKLLNLITSFYKWKTIICFFKNNFILDGDEEDKFLRKNNVINNIEVIDKYLNIYDIDSAILMLDKIQNHIHTLLNDKAINSIDKRSYDLLILDYNNVLDYYNKFKIIYIKLKSC